MLPVRIKVLENDLLITWKDASESVIKLANLRRQCPCAQCAFEKAQQSNSYTPIYSMEELTIKSINSCGNYAIAVSWADNHNTGIYEFDYLKQLSENTLPKIK